MTDPAPPTPDDLLRDPLLRDAPVVEGFKVLDPAVLYAHIGKGGMGAVYRGLHCKLNLDVAVKCLMPSLAAEDPSFIERFEREARLAASLTHQNVVRVMDVQNHRGLHYLVMEFVRGETVRERVVRKGPLAEAEALTILFGACSGLAEAHGRGIVHRDIKPDNLLISIEGRVKVADLGLARGTAPGESGGTLSSGGMGTPQYMPPEQWERSDVGPTADVWAIGAVLYFLLAGEHAIADGPLHTVARAIGEQEFPNLRQRRPELRPEVHALFERCVRRAPHERFADAAELLLALRALGCADEVTLRDPDGSARRDGKAMVTPPPRETVLRIRAVLETEPEVAAPGHGSARPALTKPAHGPQVGPRVAHAAGASAEAGDSTAEPVPTMPSAELLTVKSPAFGQAPAAVTSDAPADDAAPTRASAPAALPAPKAELPLPTPLPQGLEHAAQVAAASSRRAPAVDRPGVADRAAAPTPSTAAPGRRWWWLLLLVIGVMGAGFAVRALLRDDRVHPVTEPLFRPIDQFETPPPNDPADGDRPRRDGGK
ncbi:MAG: serine/threonine protein kinase [Planctomycetes bacterium]|jgi:serine/threonine-protein kinase|nr:serine/threonine protein kinase [Planctomycetota bacterium]